MKSRWIAALLSAASLVLAFGLTACGGSGDSSSSPSSAATTAAPTTEKTTAESPDSSSGALTPPGTTLGFGEEATVGWVPPSEFDTTAAQQGIELGVAVEAIEKGSLDDFANIELEPDQEHSTPYYVKVSVEAVGSYESKSSDDPDVTFTAIDDRGQEQGSVTFLGEFPTCEDEPVPQPFKSGESYESCLTYLMPGGGSIEKVQWSSGPSEAEEITPYFDEPIVWEGS